MPDNVTASAVSGSGGPIFATDQDSGTLAHYPKGKLVFGANDTFTDVSLASGFPVQPGTSTTWSVTQSGTWNITNVSGTVSLPTGAATAAKQPALGTAGTASSDVLTVQGIASMTALKVDGSAVTQPVSNSGTFATQASQSGTWNIGTVTTLTGITNTVTVNDAPTTSGGLSMHQLVSAATNNATSVKGSAGQVFSIALFNNSANVAYFKLYNKATAPSPASDTPVLTYLIPASGGTNGSGVVLNIDKGFAFSAGIAYAIVGGVGTTDNTSVAASAYVVSLGYK